jgi:O-antigen ligase
VVGGSSASPVSAGAVRIASAPLLAIGLYRLLDWRLPRGAAWPLMLLPGAAVLLIAQRVALPAEIWTRLPGRALAVEVYRAAKIAPPPLPLSLTPWETWYSLLGLLPPAAMLVAGLSLNLRARRLLVLAFLLAALASLILGMLQVADGPHSALRFYAITSPDAAVGFFANRNHEAALLVCAVPLAAAAAGSRRGRGGQAGLVQLAAMLALALMLVVALSVTRSRAGVMLLAPAFVGALVIAFKGRFRHAQQRGDWAPFGAIAGAVVLGAVLVAVFNLTPLADRFREGVSDETRAQLAARTIQAGLAYAPFGSGAGSFQPVYKTVETPETLTSAYINHAHNEYAEVWLEAGWAGLALIALFLVWWTVRTLRLLGREPDPQALLGLAGAAVTGLLLAHSLVDYPLRTASLPVLFSFGCVLMLPAGQRRSSDDPR